MNELAIFAGAGGGLLASRLLGWNTICAVEIERYPREVLLQRQRDGMLERFPIWDDVRTFDGNPWRGLVDVISGGFPCQDISAAGKGAGITGERSGLWKEYARIIGEVRPRFVFAENSPLLRTRGLGVVLEDLASLGYDARWGVLGAWHLGLNHRRDRMWVLAYLRDTRLEGHTRNVKGLRDQGEIGSVAQSGLRIGGWRPVVYAADLLEDQWCPLCGGDYGDSESCKCPGPTQEGYVYRTGTDNDLWARPEISPSEPGMERVVDGVADWMDRVEATGNGQVPLVAATAFNILSEGLI